jgi:hypothetical protein
MSLMKVAAGVGVVIVILLAVLVLYTTTKPPLTVKSVELTDMPWHSAGVKILFKAEKYPVRFYLMTSEGEVLKSYEAKLPEEVVYMAIGNPYENIVGPRRYVVKAFVEDKEVFKREIDVRGVAGSIRILNASVSLTTGPIAAGIWMVNITEPKIGKILVEVENSGDAPLYLTFLSSPLSVDGTSLGFKPSKEVVMPGSRERVELSIEPLVGLEKGHTFTISVPGLGNASYTVEPLRPEVRIDRVDLVHTILGWWTLNITVTIRNTCAYPVALYHLEVYVDNQLIPAVSISRLQETVSPGEEKTTTAVIWSLEKKPSTVKVKLYGTEAVYQIP